MHKHWHIPQHKAVSILNNVAAQYGIEDASNIINMDDLLYLVTKATQQFLDNPTDKQFNILSIEFYLILAIESDLGIDPGDPRECAEYEMYLRV
jgi:hypothetical protein